LHPAYVLRADHELERFYSALVVVEQCVSGTFVKGEGVGSYHVLTEASDVEELIAAFRADKSVVAYDTETGVLSPFDRRFPQLLCVSMTSETGTGYVVPYDHAESPWVDSRPEARRDRVRVRDALRAFFQDATVPKIAQHEKFDRNHIRRALGVDVAGVVGDTLLLHYALDERRGTHGLDMLAHQYTGMGGYELPLEAYVKQHKDANPRLGGSYANIPGAVLFPYAAADADVTLRAFLAMSVDENYQSSPQPFWLYDATLGSSTALDAPPPRVGVDFALRVSRTLAQIEYNGAQIDPDAVEGLRQYYEAEMNAVSARISKLDKVREYECLRAADGGGKNSSNQGWQELAGACGVVEHVSGTLKQPGKEFTFNAGSPVQLAELLFGLYGEAPIELTDGGFTRLVERHKALVEEARRQRKQEPSFAVVVRTAARAGEWKFFSTKADVLHELARRGNPLAELIVAYRAAQIMRSTFVEPLRTELDERGLIHGTFSNSTTVTGRLSSANPNLQNCPNKGGGRVKRAYVSRFGTEEGVILQLDYGQIELRVAASLFDEPNMIAAYRAGDDIHALTAIAVHGGSREDYLRLPDDEQKTLRVAAKRLNFGVLYGGGAQALEAALKKEAIFWSRDQCEAFIATYFEVRPTLKAGIEALMEDAKRLGYVRSFTGRVRRIPEVYSTDERIAGHALRQAVNFPVQSGAAEMTLMALVVLSDALVAADARSKVILTVHDSIVIDTHVDELYEVATLGKEVMEDIPVHAPKVFDGIDWSWLKVPLKADCEVGTTWGTLTKFDLAMEEDAVWDAMRAKANS
jgi:DNA polymerase I-like protein with 3'-5' exonuclease and polymerase domains